MTKETEEDFHLIEWKIIRFVFTVKLLRKSVGKYFSSSVLSTIIHRQCGNWANWRWDVVARCQITSIEFMHALFTQRCSAVPQDFHFARNARLEYKLEFRAELDRGPRERPGRVLLSDRYLRVSPVFHWSSSCPRVLCTTNHIRGMNWTSFVTGSSIA